MIAKTKSTFKGPVQPIDGVSRSLSEKGYNHNTFCSLYKGSGFSWVACIVSALDILTPDFQQL